MKDKEIIDAIDAAPAAAPPETQPAEATPAATERELEAKPRKKRLKAPHEVSRFVHAVNNFRRALGAEFDAPDLLAVTKFSEDEFLAAKRRVLQNVAAALGPLESPPIVPTIDVQLANFSDWQGEHGEYYRWQPFEMEALRRKLVELGEGAELFFCYAMSVGVKLRSGRLLLIDRRGQEIKR